MFRVVGLVMAYSTLGREAEAEIELQRLILEYGENNPAWVAEAYSWRGQFDEAFDWLEMAYAQRDISLSYMLGNNVSAATKKSSCLNFQKIENVGVTGCLKQKNDTACAC